jgi:hypothetical protein
MVRETGNFCRQAKDSCADSRQTIGQTARDSLTDRQYTVRQRGNMQLNRQARDTWADSQWTARQTGK